MPNWVYNRVYGSKDIIDKLLDNNRKVTFKNVIPIPKEMIALDTYKDFDHQEINALIEYVFEKDNSGIHTLLSYPRYSGETFETLKDKLLATYPLSQLDLCVKLKQQYGTFYWYDWRCSNWGCKWDASNDFTPDGGYPEGTTEIEFQTPWDSPGPVMKKLVDDYPDLEFTWHSDEESCMFSVDFVASGDGSFFEEDVFPEYYTPYIQEPDDLNHNGMSECTSLSEARHILKEELGEAPFDLAVESLPDSKCNIKLTVYDWQVNGGKVLYTHEWKGLDEDA